MTVGARQPGLSISYSEWCSKRDQTRSVGSTVINAWLMEELNGDQPDWFELTKATVSKITTLQKSISDYIRLHLYQPSTE